MKTQAIQTDMLGQPVTVTKLDRDGMTVQRTWQGIVRNVVLDADGSIRYTVQAILTESPDRRGKLSDHYSHELTLPS